MVTVSSVGTAIIGVWFVSSGMIGYGFGRTGGWTRVAALVGGALLLLPVEMVYWAVYANLMGGALAAMVVAAGLMNRHRRSAITS